MFVTFAHFIEISLMMYTLGIITGLIGVIYCARKWKK